MAHVGHSHTVLNHHPHPHVMQPCVCVGGTKGLGVGGWSGYGRCGGQRDGRAGGGVGLGHRVTRPAKQGPLSPPTSRSLCFVTVRTEWSLVAASGCQRWVLTAALAFVERSGNNQQARAPTPLLPPRGHCVGPLLNLLRLPLVPALNPQPRSFCSCTVWSVMGVCCCR